jgi:hypothetical protein
MSWFSKLLSFKKNPKSSDLELGPAGVTFRASRAFGDRGVSVDLLTSTAQPMTADEFQGADKDALRAQLAPRAKTVLDHAEAALKSLIAAALDPAELKWLGIDEAEARRRFLSLPERLPAHEATTLAKRRLKDLKQETG